MTWSVVRNDAGKITEKTEVLNGVSTTYGHTYDDLGRLLGNIVEQTASYINKLGSYTIQNSPNIVRISHGVGTLHNKISAYYSSIQKFTNGLTVRAWLQTKDLNFQYNYGLEILSRFAKEIGAKIEFAQ